MPIEFVNIYFENGSNNNSTGSISNELGEFTLRHNEYKATFSHINYESLTINLNEDFNEIKAKTLLMTGEHDVGSTVEMSQELNKKINKK